MSEHFRQRSEALFQRCADLDPGARSAFLDEHCPDPSLRAEVESLLVQLDAGTADFLRSPGPTARRDTGGLAPGQVLGERYKVLQPLGEGGLGVVWLAEQLPPVRRKVAVKVVKLGMDTKEVLGRFEIERNALARMDHAGIARVFDAGVTESGQPYFVMEYVAGVPITEFCDTECLPTRRRLELFQEVCRAVQHAHQKGIIHRDLKPSNILVALQEGRAVPKVIDFDRQGDGAGVDGEHGLHAAGAADGDAGVYEPRAGGDERRGGGLDDGHLRPGRDPV